jgi:YVTN family beta-propeller protein
VAIKGNDTAYVSSIRDREIDVVNLSGSATLTDRIKVAGQPNKMILNTAQTKLYVAEDQTDSVDVIDTALNKVAETIPAGASQSLVPSKDAKYTGNNTNSVTLSPDEKTLYVTNGITNNVAMISLSTGSGTPSVAGLIPTGWYPT